MRLPWNRKYIEISFHLILTIFILSGMWLFLFRFPQAKNVILQTARGFLAVFAPLFWAIFFTLLLEPLVAYLQKIYEKRCSLRHRSKIRNRKAGTTLTYLLLLLLVFFFSMYMARKMGDADLNGIAEQISGFIRRMGDVLVLLNLKLAEYGILQNVEGLLHTWIEQVTLGIETKILGFARFLPNLGESFLDIIIAAAVAFYFLMEKARILQISRELSEVCLGNRLTKGMRSLFYEVYSIFSGYLNGQILDAVIMAILFAVTFQIVGLPHAIFLGVLSGFSNLIPYFGAITAFTVAIFSALLSGTPMKALYASVLIILLQQIDSLFIVPKVIGKRLEMHPVLVLLSLAVFGRLLGFWGLLFAVPLGALCKNFLFWLYERKKTRYYQ